MRNRVGKFQLSRSLVDNNPDYALRVMAKVIVVRCELMYSKDGFDYTALSRDFDELSVGEAPPLYKAVCNSTTGEILFERVRDFTVRVG